MKHHIIFGHAKSNVSDNQFFTGQLESIVSVTHCKILVWVYAEKGIRFLTQTGEKPSQTIDKERLSREKKAGTGSPHALHVPSLGVLEILCLGPSKRAE